MATMSEFLFDAWHVIFGSDCTFFASASFKNLSNCGLPSEGDQISQNVTWTHRQHVNSWQIFLRQLNATTTIKPQNLEPKPQNHHIRAQKKNLQPSKETFQRVHSKLNF